MVAVEAYNTGEGDLYPKIEPYDHGMLPVGSGHSLYWEQSGNPNGEPVIFLHGGPGAGTTPNHRRFFDPVHYRIILFDQRGAGRSTPYANITDNTTNHLIADIEMLRGMLGVEKWLVFGGSWGATLALVYAERYPEHCLGMILRGVFMGRKSELDWFLFGISHIYPEAWQTFVDFLPSTERSDLANSYYCRLIEEDPNIHGPAAAAWHNYEMQCSTLRHHISEPTRGYGGNVLALARLEAHYFVNDLFLSENEILKNVGKIADLPAIIIQGRYDMICPIISAKQLADSGTGMVLNIVDDAGHSAMEPGIRRGLVAAANSFRDTGHFRGG